MQAMGTPITVTTPNPGDVAAIQPASGAPAAPFDAVLALVAPTAAPADPLVVDPAAALAPVGATPEIAVPTSGMVPNSALQALAIPPVQPVFSSMVNTADPAETDIAALMAASALATRGVAARAPSPVSIPEMVAEPAAPLPEDFIGPVCPTELTAEPAALAADSAAGLPEAAEFRPLTIASLPPVDPDFIGPMLPAERRRAPDAGAVLSELPAEPQPLLATTDVAPLLEAQALLQPVSETVALEQPEHPMATPLVMTLDPGHAPAHAANSVMASSVPNVAVVAIDTPVKAEPSVSTCADSAGEAPVIRLVARASGEAATRVVDHELRDVLVPPPIAMSPNIVEALQEQDIPAATIHEQHDRVIAEFDPAMDPILAAAMVQPSFVIATNIQDATPTSSAPSQVEARDLEIQPRMAPAIATDPRSAPLPLSRDEALLRVINEIAPEKPQAAPKIERGQVLKSGSAEALITTPASEVAVRLSSTPLSDAARVDADGTRTLHEALARASVDRSEARQLNETHLNTVARDAEAEQKILDPKIAAMVRSVTVTHGSPEMTADNAVHIAAIASAPVVIPSTENVAREANVVASVNADGRRDTKRDAEIRQRQVEQQINLALRSGTPEIRMQLYPPGLGQVIIRLALDGQRLRLSMTADNDEASDSLAQTEIGLRDALSRNGYTLAGFDVRDHGDKDRRRNNQADAAIQSTVPSEEGDAFSVDMTA